MAVALLWLLSAFDTGLLVVRADSHTVCLSGPPACDYSTIQDAVDAATDGDVVKVAAGTYTDIHVRLRQDFNAMGTVTQVVYISKSVTISGGYTSAFTEPPDPVANPTTLDAQNQGRVLYITGNISPTVTGLNITGGNAEGQAEPGVDTFYGGGVFAITATVTIRGSNIYSNTAGEVGLGHGVVFVNANAIFENNRVMNNGHYHGFGGGLAMDSSNATLNNNIISGNEAFYGGGVWICRAGVVLLTNTIIRDNTAREGGGLYLCVGGNVTLARNVITNNTADSFNYPRGGGGISISYDGQATLINNVITGNQSNTAGGGLYVDNGSQGMLLHNTIARNDSGDGSGIYIAEGAITMTNTILVSHTVGISTTSAATVTLEATLWGSDAWANGTDWTGDGLILTGTINIFGDPVFVNPDAGDYHIGESSAAIDVGVDAGVRDDIDGHPRPIGDGYDIGADEFRDEYTLFLPILVKP